MLKVIQAQYDTLCVSDQTCPTRILRQERDIFESLSLSCNDLVNLRVASPGG